MKDKKHLFIIIAAIAAGALIAAAAAVIMWHLGAFLPGWIQWRSSEAISGAGIVVSLDNRKAAVSLKNGPSFWASPEDVLAQDFLCGDIDHDGEDELLLLCWKIGRYRDAVPRFGAGEERRWFQHIYIYDMDEQSVHAIWMASEIGIDVQNWCFDGDHLILQEPSGRETEWFWDDWGLEFVSEVKK